MDRRLVIALLLSLALHGWLLWVAPAPQAPQALSGEIALALGELRLSSAAPGREAESITPVEEPAKEATQKQKKPALAPRPQRRKAADSESPAKDEMQRARGGAEAQIASAPDIGAGEEPVLVDRPAFAVPPGPPRYPHLARQRRQQGTVVIEVQLGRSGEQVRRQIMQTSGVASLDEAALAAVKSWQFLPYRENGRPRPSRVRLPIRFTL